jgi:hypothetical protein
VLQGMLCRMEFKDTIADPRFYSAQRSDTSLVTAPRLVDTVEDSVVTRADTEVLLVDTVEDVEDKPATLAVVTDTCPVRLDPPLVLTLLTTPRRLHPGPKVLQLR